MSLQVWLPLNGNLKNQGISNTTWTTSTATVAAGGVLGNCYSLSTLGSGNGIYLNTSSMSVANFMDTYINNHAWTLAGWIKTTATSATPLFGLTYGLRFFVGSSTSMSLYNSSRTVSCNANTATNDGNWHHVAGTYDPSTNKIAIYVDGICKNTAQYTSGYTYASSWTNIVAVGRDPNNSTANTSYFYSGSLNDIRIYDNALSGAEIKELSKGMFIHYKFDDGHIESTTNINADKSDQINTVSTTCYNGATSKYGYGTDTDIYKTIGVFQGKKCTKIYMGTAGNSARPYTYLRNMFVALSSSTYPASKAVSFDYYATRGNYILPYSLGSGTATAVWKVTNSSGTSTGQYSNWGQFTINPGEWNHVEIVFTATTTAAAEWGYIINGDAATSTLEDYWLYANIQIEEKDHVTPYTYSSRSYTTLTDESGYKNNGTIVGSPSISNDSKRYSYSTHFTSSSTKAYMTVPYTGNNYTIAWWANYTPGSNMPWGYSNGNRLNPLYACCLNVGDGTSNPWYTPGTTTTITAPSAGWHHYAITGNGSYSYLYVDGELYGQAKAFKALTGTTIYFNGWDSGTSYSANEYISDYRMYASALSAKDIKDLYNVGAKISSAGSLLCYEIKEQ